MRRESARALTGGVHGTCFFIENTHTTYFALALCTLPDMDNTNQKTKRSQTSRPEAVDVTGTEVACLSVTGATALLSTMTAF